MDDEKCIKWEKIANSIMRLEYLGKKIVDQPEPYFVNELNKDYHAFVKNQFGIDSEEQNVKLIDFDFLLGLSYLTLGRIIEFIENDMDPDYIKEAFSPSIWEYKFSSFDELMSSYQINLKIFYSKDQDDKGKLRKFVKSIRNALMHFNYYDKEDLLILKSENTKEKEIDLECEIEKRHFLNFCIHFGYCIHNFIRKKIY